MIPDPAQPPDRLRAAGELAQHASETAAMDAPADAEVILRNTEDLRSP
ncbi:hypothetical protein [Nonomuraea sp. NPDC049480]